MTRQTLFEVPEPNMATLMQKDEEGLRVPDWGRENYTRAFIVERERRIVEDALRLLKVFPPHWKPTIHDLLKVHWSVPYGAN